MSCGILFFFTIQYNFDTLQIRLRDHICFCVLEIGSKSVVDCGRTIGPVVLNIFLFKNTNLQK